MKYFTVVPLAALLAFAAVPGAQAFGIGASGVPTSTLLEEGYLATDVPHHACHAMTSGTAHWSCGSRTGGPSGSLF